jgi:ubiquinol-cytochrome c reductase cytochrome b subunit
LLITLAFGLTGYLLPWDNRAYWGTVVTTQIAGQAPIAGPYLTRLLGGSVGNVTFSRFYALHTVLLPPLTMILIGIHIYLVRKHGVTPAVDDTAPRRKFFPEQVFKDTVGVAIGFLILFMMAVFARVPLGRLADPTDTTFVPRPEWYFLFLFQTLKFFKGPLEAVGSVVLPGVALLALFLIPFIDRGPLVRLGKRTFAFTFAALALLAWTGLTTAAIMTTPKTTEADETAPGAENLQAWQQLTPEELQGLAFFRKENCKACHPGAGKRGIGPDLTQMIPAHRTAAWMIPHFKNPAQVVPGSSMPPVHLDDAGLNALSAFVLKLTPQSEQAVLSTPDFVVQGALIYQTNHCDACHQIMGAGQKLGPPLDGVGERRDRAWLEKHFQDPKSTSPGSIMPPYKFTPQEMDAICKYLGQLPKAGG